VSALQHTVLRGLCCPVRSSLRLRLTVCRRFVAVPATELKEKLGSQIKEIETDVEGLGKRLHYLETTAKNSQEHIEHMLGKAGPS
jgi:hypothetical protein